LAPIAGEAQFVGSWSADVALVRAADDEPRGRPPRRQRPRYPCTKHWIVRVIWCQITLANPYGTPAVSVALLEREMAKPLAALAENFSFGIASTSSIPRGQLRCALHAFFDYAKLGHVLKAAS